MILTGDSLTQLQTLQDRSIQCCVTSPPYYGLRDYGTEGQIGLEETPEEFIEKLVEVFREVRRVLTDDGTLWVNMGDSYTANRGYQVPDSKHIDVGNCKGMKAKDIGLKPKDLIGIPWRVAFALQSDGWYLRQDIIWNKPNPMPESVRDRCTKAHEYIFLLSKSARYYYDADAIKEPAKRPGEKQAFGGDKGRKYTPSADDPNFRNGAEQWGRTIKTPITRNKRSVWTVSTKPFKGAHFATFPPDLIEPCILAGSRPGDTVLDPFSGAGTTGLVALKHGRKYVGIELNPEYVALQEQRLAPYRAAPLLSLF